MHGERKENKPYIVIAVVLMFCVYGLRDTQTVGNDSTAYRKVYESIGESDWSDLPSLDDWLHSDEADNSHDRNVADRWLMKVLHELTDGDYQVYVTVVSAFVMLVFAHFIRKYSPSPLADYYFQFAIVFIPMVFEDVKTRRRHLSERQLTLVRHVGPYVFCAFAIWRFISFVSGDNTLNQYQFYFQAEKAAEDLLLWRFS